MTDAPYVVEVAYAKPEEQVLLTVQVTGEITAEEAIKRSHILDRYPEIDLASTKLGIFGRVVRKDAVLHPGDRVEIYRPLIADPKEARQKRAAQGKSLKKGAGGK